jgi:uncharacterized protein
LSISYVKPRSICSPQVLNMFENRIYRSQHNKKGLVSFNITVKETNLNIQAEKDLTDIALKAVLECRNKIETYIRYCPEFVTSFVPIQTDIPGSPIIRDMLEAGRLVNVGPMAAVAGAVAEYTGKALLKHSQEVIVENGGDVFIKTDSETISTIYAGKSPLSMKFGIKFKKNDKAFGLCTSSGTIGHSKSFGRADSATILSDSCSLADAAATQIGNIVKTDKDIQAGLDFGKSIPGIRGIVIIIDKNIGLWGDMELVRLQESHR